MQTDHSPFHSGERRAQNRAGAGDIATRAAGFIRDHFPQQHLDFHTRLPFLVVSSADEMGRVWVTVVEGEEGFINALSSKALHIDNTLDPEDPLHDAFARGADIGVLGIELASRRRNRFSASLTTSEPGYHLAIRQTFGNCPQYINERNWTREDRATPAQTIRSAALSKA